MLDALTSLTLDVRYDTILNKSYTEPKQCAVPFCVRRRGWGLGLIGLYFIVVSPMAGAGQLMI